MTSNYTTTPPTGDLSVIFTPAYDPEQRRRKVLTYYKSLSKNLRQTVLSTSEDLTDLDAARIVSILGENIDSYNGPETKATFRKGFRLWAVEWVSRIALLTSTTLPLIPALTRLAESTPGLGQDDYQHVANRILNALPQYDGHVYDTDHLADWAANWVTRETQATVALVEWVEQHRGAVYGALWSILSGCKDLGADEGTADELSCDVWAYVAENVHRFLEDGAPLHLRLWELAATFARNWRSSRIDDRNKFRDATEAEQIRALDTAAGVPPVRKAPLETAEPVETAVAA